MFPGGELEILLTQLFLRRSLCGSGCLRHLNTSQTIRVSTYGLHLVAFGGERG